MRRGKGRTPNSVQLTLNRRCNVGIDLAEDAFDSVSTGVGDLPMVFWLAHSSKPCLTGQNPRVRASGQSGQKRGMNTVVKQTMQSTRLENDAANSRKSLFSGPHHVLAIMLQL